MLDSPHAIFPSCVFFEWNSPIDCTPFKFPQHFNLGRYHSPALPTSLDENKWRSGEEAYYISRES